MDQTQLPQTKMMFEEREITFTWIKSVELSSFKPFFQVYGIVFNRKGEILLIREKGKWKIPGGTPEDGETEIETLKRELIEEADVKISNVFPLGAQRVEFPNNPNKKEGDLYYQLRYVCLMDELLPSTPDPATGLMNDRMFVPADKVTEYVKWGNTGSAMFTDAVEVFKRKFIE